MTSRNNKRPGAVAKCLFAMIVRVTAAFAWIALRGLQKEPHGAPAGSDVLPGQAARAADAVHSGQPIVAEAAAQH